MWIFLPVILLFSLIEASTNRFVIYWDQSHNLLSAKTDRVLNVNIGQFMDILCPQTSLMDMDSQLQQPLHFSLFNVTKPDFDKCSHEGPRNFIFSCNRPERENKLTIKFQLISPSPLGFRFQYCKDYYIIAVPRDKDKWGDGCHGNSTMRLHIKVACKKELRHHTSLKISFTTPATTLRHIPADDDLDTLDDPVRHPNIVRPRPPIRNDSVGREPNLLAQTGKRKNSGNVAALHKSTFSLICAALYLSYVIVMSFR